MENSCSANPKPKTTREFITSWYFWKPFLAISIGGLAGFLYYFYIGCSSGTCAITSNPYKSSLMGAFIGWFSVGSPCSRGKC